MKKYILTIFILLNLSGFSQPITFSKVYNPYNKNYTFSNANAILAKGNGYLVVGVGDDSTSYFKKNIQVYELDSIGNIIKFASYGKDSCNYFAGAQGSFVKTYDGGYCLAGTIQFGSVLNHLIMRFNSNLDTLWTKTYISNAGINEDIIYQLCETTDKGFAYVGLRAITTTLWDVFLLKTDSLGNKLWEKGISLGNYSVGGEIQETPDKGFLICGYRSYYNDGPEGPFVIKTDSMGNVLWYRLLGNAAEKNGAAATAITAQGDYLVAYGYSTYTYPMNIDWSAKLNVIKYSPDGYQIWNKMYDTIKDAYSVHKIQVYSNSDFIVMGSFAQPTQGNSYSFFTTFMFKCNANGDSLYRKIYYNSKNYGDENYLYDNVLNADGSITACGLASSDTMLPNYKIWILKTDTILYAPGCFPTGVKVYYYTQKGELKIFPNPATTQTTITYPTADKVIMLQIYNMLGQMEYEEKLSKGSSQTTIDTREYKKGLYKVVVGESSASLLITN